MTTITVSSRRSNTNELRCSNVLERVRHHWDTSPDDLGAVELETGNRMTYGELDARSAAIAGTLVDRGIGSGSRVGLWGERTLELVVGLFAILRAGAAYVPLDPRAPRAHARRVLEVAGVDLVLAPATDPIPDGPWDVLRHDEVVAGRTFVEPRRSAADPAYILFTSGSSGCPKGVVVTDANLAAYAGWATNEYDFRPGGRTLVHSPVTFDFTVTTLICPLMCGGVVELLGDDNPAALVSTLAATSGLDVLKLTPAHVQLISRSLRGSELADLARTVVLGGEALYRRQVAPWQEAAPGTVFVNEYGPTEATVGCCVYRLPDGGRDEDVPVPIGRPITGAHLHLVGPDGSEVEEGEVGEIWIGGPMVAHGYIGAAPGDERRFFVHPRWGKVYATGDLARRTDEGLVYLGRLDDQVKIRGHRIETGEVEAALSACSGIAAAVVSAVSRRGRTELVAHVVADGDDVPVDELRRDLAQRVPEYMVPSSWVWLDELPLTPNGKVDRRSLPAPGRERPLLTSEAVAPADGLERAVVAVCAEVLELAVVGVEDDLLSLGADSLALDEIAERVEALLGTPVPLDQLFETPSVGGIARFLRGARNAERV